MQALWGAWELFGLVAVLRVPSLCKFCGLRSGFCREYLRSRCGHPSSDPALPCSKLPWMKLCKLYGVVCFVFPSQSDLSVWGIPYSFSSTSNIWENPYKILVNGKKKKDLKTGYRVWTHLYVWLYTHSSRNTTHRKIFGTPKMFPGVIAKF